MSNETSNKVNLSKFEKQMQEYAAKAIEEYEKHQQSLKDVVCDNFKNSFKIVQQLEKTLIEAGFGEREVHTTPLTEIIDSIIVERNAACKEIEELETKLECITYEHNHLMGILKDVNASLGSSSHSTVQELWEKYKTYEQSFNELKEIHQVINNNEQLIKGIGIPVGSWLHSAVQKLCEALESKNKGYEDIEYVIKCHEETIKSVGIVEGCRFDGVIEQLCTALEKQQNNSMLEIVNLIVDSNQTKDFIELCNAIEVIKKQGYMVKK